MSRAPKTAFPTARDVRVNDLVVEIGRHTVRYESLIQRQNDRYRWLVHGPWDADGIRESIDEFATYREAVRCAKEMDRLASLVDKVPPTAPKSEIEKLKELLRELEFVDGDDRSLPSCRFCEATGPDHNPTNRVPAEPHDAECPLAVALGLDTESP